MTIERVSEPTDEVMGALARLLPQLSKRRRGPTPEELARAVREPATHLLLARDEGGEIVGTLTLVVHVLATGLAGWIDDVVVDDAARGRGVGAALVEDALERARAAGARQVGLTTRPAREAANRLYARLGFVRRDTNVYVWRPQPEPQPPGERP